MTELEFKNEMIEKKAEYIEILNAYLDALVECDFSKAIELGGKIFTIFSPDASAFMAERMYKCDNYESLEDTYMESVSTIGAKIDEALGD